MNRRIAMRAPNEIGQPARHVQAQDLDPNDPNYIIPYKYDYTPLNLESKSNKKIIKKLAKYENIGMKIPVVVGKTKKMYKMTVRYGNDDLYEKDKNYFETNDKKYNMDINKHLTMDRLVISECLLKIKKYDKFFESIVWNVIGLLEPIPNVYLESIQHYAPHRAQAAGARHRNYQIAPILQQIYEKIGDDIVMYAPLYFQYTLDYMRTKMAKHIKEKMQIAEVQQSADAIAFWLILYYGEKNYYAILENIDELIKFTTPKMLEIVGSLGRIYSHRELTPPVRFDFDLINGDIDQYVVPVNNIEPVHVEEEDDSY